MLDKVPETSSRNGAISVLDRGSGPAVVFIPVLGSDHRMFAPQIEALSDRFRCLAVDLRGCGASPSLDGVPEDEVVERQARDIVDALDERGIGSAHLVGISYGGAVAQAVMNGHGDRVASAVICDSFGDLRPRDFGGRLLVLGAKLQPLLYRLPRRWLAAAVLQAYRRWPDAGRALADVMLHSRRDDLSKQRRAVNAFDMTKRLRTCAVPTLCLAGDRVPPVVAMMRRLDEALPESEFALIEDAADPSNLCRPEYFSEVVEEWVNRHESDSHPATEERGSGR